MSSAPTPMPRKPRFIRKPPLPTPEVQLRQLIDQFGLCFVLDVLGELAEERSIRILHDAEMSRRYIAVSRKLRKITGLQVFKSL
jgi:hypothetical protein